MVDEVLAAPITEQAKRWLYPSASALYRRPVPDQDLFEHLDPVLICTGIIGSDGNAQGHHVQRQLDPHGEHDENPRPKAGVRHLTLFGPT